LKTLVAFFFLAFLLASIVCTSRAESSLWHSFHFSVDTDTTVTRSKKDKESLSIHQRRTTSDKSVNKDYTPGFTSCLAFEFEDTIIRKPKKQRKKMVQDSASVKSIMAPVDSSKLTLKNKKKSKTSLLENTGNTDTLESRPPSTANAVIDTSSQPKKRKKLISANESDISSKDTVITVNTIAGTLELIAASIIDSGRYHLDRGNYTRARVFFDSIINYYGNTLVYKSGFYYMAKCKAGLQDYTGAINDFNYFRMLIGCSESECFDVYYNVGLLRFKLGQTDQAILDFERAAKDTTYINYKYIFFYRGFCYAQQEKYINAIQDLTRFLNMENAQTFSTAEARYYRGYYKAQLQDYRGAIKDYDATIELYLPYTTGKNPSQLYVQKLIEVYIVRGLAKSQLKKYDEAIADYDIVIKLKPTNAAPYRLKALDLIKKGEIEQGCLELSKAGELGSKEAYADIKQYCK